jgi:hypothetical protein
MCQETEQLFFRPLSRAVRRASEGVDTEVNTAIAGWAWRWALWTTVLQVVDGFLLLMLLPRPVLRGIMSGGVATLGVLTLAILVGIGLLMMLARVSNPVEKPGLVKGTLGAILPVASCIQFVYNYLDED